MKGLLNPAGGLRYHFTASVRKKSWQNFKNELNEWMMNWNPKSESVVLVGPSAGYLITDEFLKKFKQIEAWDIDPLAPVLFKKQHPKIKVKWKKKDWFKTFLMANQKPNLNTAYVFTGILGQLSFLVKDDQEYDKVFKALNEFLSDTPFLSFHDRWVSHQSFKKPHPNALMSTETLDIPKIIKHFWEYSEDQVIEEHELGKLYRHSRSFFYGAWDLRNKEHHIIEGICI